MYQKSKQVPMGKVPLETHYAVFKDVEKRIHDFLRGDPHEQLLIGLRVAYDERDSSNEPGVLPYKVESGYLGFVDLLFNCDLVEDTEEVEGSEEKWTFPLSAEIMDELYEMVRDALQSAAGSELNVGVFYTFTGSPTQAGGIRCSCKLQSNKRERITGSSTRGRTSKSCKKGC